MSWRLSDYMSPTNTRNHSYPNDPDSVTNFQVIWWRHEKASAKNFNAVSHNRARPEVLFSNLKHGGREKVFIYMFLAVVRLVAVFKRTVQAYWNWLSVADIFLRFARHCSAENRQKNSPKRHRAKRKTINCVNLKSSDMATLETKSLPKLWHPRFHSTVLSVDKCGHQTWFINEQLK